MQRRLVSFRNGYGASRIASESDPFNGSPGEFSEGPVNNVLVPLIVGSALFMELLDSTVITTALPAMARSLHTDPIRLNVAITSYLLSLAVFIPISTWVADKYGARTVFRFAIVVFTIGSVFCGVSRSLATLVGARILQGFGGAMMVPVGRVVILKTVPKSGLVRAMSYLSVQALLGPVVGPPVGGFIVTYSSWRWIFFINVPICLLGIALVTMFIENIREPDVPPLDFVGFMLTGVGLAGLVFGFESVGRTALPPVVLWGVLLTGICCTTLYVVHSRRVARPIVNLELLRIPTFQTAVVAGGVFRMGIGAMPFLLAMLLQLAFGLTAFASGLIIFVSAAGAMTMKLTVNPIIRAFGFRTLLIANGVVSSIFMLMCATFRPSTPHILIALVLFSGGFFRSLQFTCLNALAYADVPSPLMSNASCLSSMTQQLTVSVGVALGALVLRVCMAMHGVTTLSAHEITPAFLIMGVLTLFATLFFLPLPPHAGAELSGHRSLAMLQREPAALVD